MCHGSRRCRDQETSLGLTVSETSNINDHLTLRNTHSSKEPHPKAFEYIPRRDRFFYGGGAEVAVEREIPTCVRPHSQPRTS